MLYVLVARPNLLKLGVASKLNASTVECRVSTKKMMANPGEFVSRI